MRRYCLRNCHKAASAIVPYGFEDFVHIRFLIKNLAGFVADEMNVQKESTITASFLRGLR